MSFPFTTTNLLEPTEEEIKVLITIAMQNGLIIQQLQLMVALRQKQIEKEEEREKGKWLKEREAKEEEEKQEKLRKEEVQSIKGWTEEESQKYVERFRGYRGDTRCRKCG